MKQKEITIITHGEPSIEVLSASEQQTFYAALLSRISELYRRQRRNDEKPSQS